MWKKFSTAFFALPGMSKTKTPARSEWVSLQWLSTSSVNAGFLPQALWTLTKKGGILRITSAAYFDQMTIKRDKNL